MAEIKSTLEMVMERAARMSAEVPEVNADQAAEEQGMKLAALFLNGKEDNLITLLNAQPSEDQVAIRNGMVKTLLRNVTLPRDNEISEVCQLSLNTIVELSGNGSEVTAICSELAQILEQYNQHKEQVREQLDGAIRNQLKQALHQQGQSVDDEMLNPAMHPQYQEEWSKVSADLNEQYSEAINQRKEAISMRISG
ncbi:MAG: hypothetical protein D6B25_15770 [Desulfobulbaceae bacterium]|nr:MAG: hypothetical protein D6B25_15770 [Desulfobulbaceae bacterium]